MQKVRSLETAPTVSKCQNCSRHERASPAGHTEAEISGFSEAEPYPSFGACSFCQDTSSNGTGSDVFDILAGVRLVGVFHLRKAQSSSQENQEWGFNR